MKKTIFYLMVVAVFAITISSCGKDDSTDPTPTNNNGGNNNPPAKTKTEMLAKKWIVDEAYVDGSTPDNSSKGLTLDIRADGSYTLKGGYIGTWEFEENETKINFDKNKPQYNQIFTLVEFTDTKIDATFISAFTGQNARWVMIPN